MARPASSRTSRHDDDVAVCQDCGAELPGAPEMGCPACLFGLGLEQQALLPPDEPALDLESGQPQRLGDYLVLEKIARGGMGAVYRARQESLGRIVAVKVLLGGPFASRAFARRFRSEAKALARLDHPNIVSIHEVGEDHGQLYFAMDYVDGGNLADAVKDGPLTPRRAAAYLRSIADAVHSAHESGLLHRDLKPSNILLDSGDRPRVTDFGLATSLAGKCGGSGGAEESEEDGESEEESAEGHVFAGATLTGQMLGTPGYAPPEQVAPGRGAVSVKSDVYSLGAVLYHLITGRAPFGADTLEHTIFEVLQNEVVPPRRLSSSTPVDLETICLKCLAKDPAHRYESARALRDDLDCFLEGMPIQAKPLSSLEKTWRWSRRNPALALLGSAFVLALIAGSLTTAWQWRKAESERERTSKALTRMELMQAESLFESGKDDMALAYLAKVLRENPGNRVAVERAVTALAYQRYPVPEFSPMKHDAAVTSAEFSANGEWIATGSLDGTARIWKGKTGKPASPPLRHEAAVRCLKFDPAGKWLLTASSDGTARLWSVETGLPVMPSLRHQDAVNSAEFSPDGGRILTASDDATARIWDSTSGKELTPPLRHEHKVLSAHFDATGEHVITASKDHKAVVWDARTGQALGQAMVHEHGRVHEAVFSPDGRLVATASRDHSARLWHAASGSPASEPMLHHNWVMGARFSPDGLLLVSFDNASHARIWNVAQQKLAVPVLKHGHEVSDARFSRDGKLLVTASADGQARVWDCRTGELASMPMKHARGVSAASFDATGRRVLTASRDGTAMVWLLGDAARPLGPLLHPGSVKGLWSPDGSRILTTCSDMVARVWDSKSGKVLFELPTGNGVLISGAFSPDGSKLVTTSRMGSRDSGDNSGTAQLWDAATGLPLGKPFLHKHQVWSSAFSPDGTMLATASRDGTARVWRISSGEPVGPPLSHGDASVHHVLFTKDGQCIVTGANDGMARRWRIASGKLEASYSHDAAITTLALHPGGHRLLTGSSDNSVLIWDVKSGRRQAKILNHENEVTVARFSPDGRKIVTGSRDQTARVWDAETGQPLTRSLPHEDIVLDASFSPGGKRILTASGDLHTRFWDAETGHLLAEPLEHDTGVLTASFSRDGKRLLSTTGGGEMFVWNLCLPPSPPPDWLPGFLEAVAGQRLLEDGSNERVPLEKLIALRSELAASSNGDGFYRRWARWFLGLEPVRPW